MLAIDTQDSNHVNAWRAISITTSIIHMTIKKDKINISKQIRFKKVQINKTNIA